MRNRLAAILLCAGCAGSAAPADPPVGPTRYRGGDADVSRAADASMVTIPAGRYVAGSTPEEREAAYVDYARTAGSDTARDRKWFEREEQRRRAELPMFRVDMTAVTNASYAEFVADTGEPPPAIDAAEWKRQGFVQTFEREVARFNWNGEQLPEGREDHPVVLVTWQQAARYCSWRGDVVGEPRRLPSAAELEKAARGDAGLLYPWGHEFDPDKLNSAVNGPRDTVPVGSFPAGASPFGVLDLAGNVFHWTSTPWPYGKDQMTVKGSAWDDHAGVGRGASRHGRPRRIKHVILGFRCAAGGPSA